MALALVDALSSVKEKILSFNLQSSSTIPTRSAILEPECETSIKRRSINFFPVPNQN
jgi:hypothetical protein